MGCSQRIRRIGSSMKVRQTSALVSAHAMHPAAPLTTEQPVQKCRPKQLLWTGKGGVPIGIIHPPTHPPHLQSDNHLTGRAGCCLIKTGSGCWMRLKRQFSGRGWQQSLHQKRIPTSGWITFAADQKGELISRGRCSVQFMMVSSA
jgi:hypothetical protein